MHIRKTIASTEENDDDNRRKIQGFHLQDNEKYKQAATENTAKPWWTRPKKRNKGKEEIVADRLLATSSSHSG